MHHLGDQPAADDADLELDFAYSLPGKARFRVNMYRQRDAIGAAFRIIPFEIKSLESLGVPPANLVYSDYTSIEMYRAGSDRGAIDPCFPSKLGIPHVHNLLYAHHAKKPLDIVFFPVIDDLTSDLKCVQASRSCPTVASTPESVKAAFTKEGDLFKMVNPLVLYHQIGESAQMGKRD